MKQSAKKFKTKFLCASVSIETKHSKLSKRSQLIEIGRFSVAHRRLASCPISIEFVTFLSSFYIVTLTLSSALSRLETLNPLLNS